MLYNICTTRQLKRFFYESLINNDEDMAVITAKELGKRNREDVITEVLDNAFLKKQLILSPRFANTLIIISDSMPELRHYARYVRHSIENNAKLCSPKELHFER